MGPLVVMLAPLTCIWIPDPSPKARHYPLLLSWPDLGFSISCPMHLAQIFKTPKLCGLLQATDGSFGSCLGHSSPKPFLRICLQDVCRTHGQHFCLCDALTAYTAACQETGIPMVPWSGPHFTLSALCWVRDASKQVVA